MYDAAITLLVYTGGILCAAFWMIVFGIIFVEIFDKATGYDKKLQAQIDRQLDHKDL
jgi:hypothetical protein